MNHRKIIHRYTTYFPLIILALFLLSLQTNAHATSYNNPISTVTLYPGDAYYKHLYTLQAPVFVTANDACPPVGVQLSTVIGPGDPRVPKVVIRNSSGRIVATKQAVEVATIRAVFTETGSLPSGLLPWQMRAYVPLKAGEVYRVEFSNGGAPYFANISNFVPFPDWGCDSPAPASPVPGPRPSRPLPSAPTGFIEGCNPDIGKAASRAVEARVAYDMAVFKEIIVKPESVLALTCFNKAAGISSERGGEIFSGSFLEFANFAEMIEDALNNLFKQFVDAEGFDTGVVDYHATPIDDAECQNFENLWERIKDKGVTSGVPYVTMNDLLTGTLPAGAGTRFQQSWDAANTDGIFGAMAADMPPPVNTIPDGKNANTLCEVLAEFGVNNPSCP